MAPEAWLTIIGIGEDGPDGLSAAAGTALAQAASLGVLAVDSGRPVSPQQ